MKTKTFDNGLRAKYEANSKLSSINIVVMIEADAKNERLFYIYNN